MLCIFGYELKVYNFLKLKGMNLKREQYFILNNKYYVNMWNQFLKNLVIFDFFFEI